jgi:tetratricopeptide (TPR) repeat protein
MLAGDPVNAAEWKARATANARAGHLDTAVREFGEALEAWDERDGTELRSACLQNRGVCHQKLERLDAAERDFSAAVEIDPGSAAPYVNRGGVLYLLGQTAAALADFQRYLELDPEDLLGMHDAVRTHIALCAGAPAAADDSDLAGGGAASADDTDEEASLLEGGAAAGPRGGQRLPPQRRTAPPRRQETGPPRPPGLNRSASSELVRVSSEVSTRVYKPVAVCGVLAVAFIVTLLLYSIVLAV